MAAWVVIGGLVAIVLIAVVAIWQVEDDAKVAAIATAALGVIGTVVGTFFGVRLGLAHTEETMKDVRWESAKAQSFAMHMSGNQEERNQAVNDAQLLTMEPRSQEPEP